MHHEALEEVNNVKSEYEAKLITINDNLDVAMTENEVFKEKVDILFKLGRSYLNREKVGTNMNNDKADKIRAVHPANLLRRNGQRDERRGRCHLVLRGSPQSPSHGLWFAGVQI